ncbi:MAG: hypothetical protein NT917_15960 [Microcystis aeruginosa WS75]|nr:hypothetical protein [Microcystis aeruginosa WS75]
MKTFPLILQTLFNSRSTSGSINFRDLKAAQGQQETDYRGLSLKEGMEWLDQNADDFPWGKAADPDYYAFPHCPTIQAVQRQETPLTIIKHCRQP